MPAFKPHVVPEEHGELFWMWIKERVGIAVWTDPSDETRSWSTPVFDAHGKLSTPPNARCGDVPVRIITDVRDVVVSIDGERERFPIAQQELLSDESAARVREALEKAPPGSYCKFDYDSQEAVVMSPLRKLPLAEWHAKRMRLLEKAKTRKGSL